MIQTRNLQSGVANGTKEGVSTNASILTPSPSQQPGHEEKIGTWLCEQGPYQEYIAALSGSNPGLRKPDPNNAKHPLTDNNALVVMLDASAETQDFEKTEFRDPQELARHFQSTGADHDRRRIYIIEGLAKKYISVLGGYFMMDPAFFQRQERTCVWSNEFTPVSDALPQPSLLDPDKSFHLQYCELRQFNKAIENKPYFCKRTMRHVGMTSPRHIEDSTTGIMRRKISWWSRKTSNRGWDVVILCDPQLAELNVHPREYHKYSGTYKDIKESADLKSFPFQDGYVDFIPPASNLIAGDKPKHPHSSMLRDLVHYFMNHSDRFTAEDWTEPTTSSFFVKKIVAAHHLQLVDYIKAMLPSLELRLTTAWVEEQEQWKSLQTISRRCGNYRDDIEDTLLSLGYSLEVLGKRRVDWKDCEKDFQYIYFRLKILKERADTLMQSMTGLASIAGNRQNLEEAKRVKRLNLLALLFVPLAYTSSLFSMQDNFAPGNPRFWVYWVCALSVVALTLIITWVLDSALDEAAQWDVPFRRWLRNHSDNTVGSSPQKRRGTGFYNL